MDKPCSLVVMKTEGPHRTPSEEVPFATTAVRGQPWLRGVNCYWDPSELKQYSHCWKLLNKLYLAISSRRNETNYASRHLDT